MEQSKKILVVDDNLADINLLKEALEVQDIRLEIHEVYDGLEAIKYLLKDSNNTCMAPVDLVILDLNLPKKKGVEVLKEMREAGIICPVVIYTTSDSPKDVEETYSRSANCYVVKPTSTKELFALVDALTKFWLKHTFLPGKEK